jgi:hypothetical protein
VLLVVKRTQAGNSSVQSQGPPGPSISALMPGTALNKEVR